MDFQPEKPGFVLWFTGLSGSGKTTLADQIAQILQSRGQKVERLDGDTLRNLFPHTGFDRKSRDEHIRRVGFMASRLEHHGIIVIAAFISPYRDSRDFVRGMCKNFIEVYVKASLDECKRRDVKGLYQKALSGHIQQFTGLDDPYEEPIHPEIIVDTEHEPKNVCVYKIMTYINKYV